MDQERQKRIKQERQTKRLGLSQRLERESKTQLKLKEMQKKFVPFKMGQGQSFLNPQVNSMVGQAQMNAQQAQNLVQSGVLSQQQVNTLNNFLSQNVNQQNLQQLNAAQLTGQPVGISAATVARSTPTTVGIGGVAATDSGSGDTAGG